MALFTQDPNLVKLAASPVRGPDVRPRLATSPLPASPLASAPVRPDRSEELLTAGILRILEMKRLVSDHWTFLTEVLGNTNLDSAHRDLCQFLDERHRFKLILLPRSTLKTTLITIGSTTLNILRHPNTRTLLASELLKNSKKMLGAVEAQFESNPKIISTFGNLVPKRDEGKWNDTEMVVTSRTLYQAKEATVTAAGLDVEQTSAHYDRIVMDDLMSRNNTQTKEQIEKVIEYVRLCYPLLDPSPEAEMIFIGTRWHFADLYQYLIDQGRCAIFKLGAYVDEEKKILSFPNILTHEFLDQQKVEMGSSNFANQYLNVPMDDESAKFKESWLKTFTDEELPKGCFVTTTIDPAISKEPTADETFIVTVATDYRSNWYVLEERHGRWDPYEITEQLFQAVDTWHPHRVGLEKHGFQQTLEYFFTQEMQKRKTYFSIEPLIADSQTSKERRIEGLIPLFEAGRIFIRDKQSELAWQLRRYPKYPHDDGVDALSHQLQLVGVGSHQPKEQEVKENSLIALHQRESRRNMFEKNWSFRTDNRPGMHLVW